MHPEDPDEKISVSHVRSIVERHETLRPKARRPPPPSMVVARYEGGPSESPLAVIAAPVLAAAIALDLRVTDLFALIDLDDGRYWLHNRWAFAQWIEPSDDDQTKTLTAILTGTPKYFPAAIIRSNHVESVVVRHPKDLERLARPSA